jgi:regulator of replication initiation timing
MTQQRDSSPKKTRAQLLKQIESLTEAVQELRARNNHLKTERSRLEEENRTLRKELTEYRLLNHLDQSVAEADENATATSSIPPIADHFYQVLPPSFSFRTYFQIAENKDLEMDAARRFLQHFLADERVVREGSRLRKRNDSLAPHNREGNGQSSRLPA